MTLLGAGFAVWDCILVFGYWSRPGFAGTRSGQYFTYGFFGLIAVIILLLTIQEWVDIKIPFTWWGLLVVGLFIFNLVSSIANFYGYSEDYAVAGFGGTILLIAFVLHLKDY